MRYLHVAVLAVSLAAGSAVAYGDETDEMFEALFGAQLRAAAKTPQREDDLKLAEQMMAVVRETEISPALIVRTCGQARELAEASPGGAEVAVAAMRLLAAKVASERQAAQREIGRLLLKAHAAAKGDDRKRIAAMLAQRGETSGDSLARSGKWKAAAEQYELARRHASDAEARERLEEKLAAAAVQARVSGEIAELTARVKANPRDGSAREKLVWLHVAYRDSPAEAAKWLGADSSKDLRRVVPLAAGKAASLTATECATLARWYVAQSRRVEVSAKAPLLARAWRYARTYEAARGLEGRARTAAKRMTEQIETQLKRLGRADLLKQDAVRVIVAGPSDGGGGAGEAPSGGEGVLFTTDAGALLRRQVDIRGKAKMARSGAMTFADGAVITRAGEAVYTACKRSSQLTIAATLTPDNVTQDGPARIVTFSSTSDSRNFTLGQEGQSLVLRLRTTSNGTNGANHVPTLCKLSPKRPCHVVVTYTPGRLNCYVDGRHVMETDRVRGDFGNWDGKQTLMFGDERDTHRYWRGTLDGVKIFSRALSAEEAVRLSRPR